MALPDRLADVVAGLEPTPRRVLEVGAGDRFDVARAIRSRLGDVEVVVSDRTAPTPPDGLAGRAVDLTDPPDLPPVDCVVAVRLPPELWRRAEALTDRHGAWLVLHPLPEEHPPDGYDQVAAGVHVRPPGGRR